MLIIEKEGDDPFFNLAAEEYVTHRLEDDVFILWENANCVVVGKHQNAIAEVNLPFVEQLSVPVIRRISGGGTVFQGPGNINFSFVKTLNQAENQIDFARHLAPVKAFFMTLGITLELHGKSSLTLHGKKVSGNAAHVHRNRSLHHGTLLFDADLDLVRNCLKVIPGRYQSKAVLSNPMPVANIRPWLPTDQNIRKVMEQFRNYIVKTFDVHEVREFSTQEIEAIQRLADEKYHRREWNFGYTPEYRYHAFLEFDNRKFGFTILVSNDKIVEILPDEVLPKTNRIAKALLGQRPESAILTKVLSSLYPSHEPSQIAKMVYALI